MPEGAGENDEEEADGEDLVLESQQGRDIVCQGDQKYEAYKGQSDDGL